MHLLTLFLLASTTLMLLASLFLTLLLTSLLLNRQSPQISQRWNPLRQPSPTPTRSSHG